MYACECALSFWVCSWQRISRNSSFPTSTSGKGADTSILSAWLEDEMKTLESCFEHIPNRLSLSLGKVYAPYCCSGVPVTFVRDARVHGVLQQLPVPSFALEGTLAFTC